MSLTPKELSELKQSQQVSARNEQIAANNRRAHEMLVKIQARLDATVVSTVTTRVRGVS
jgi:hypothetical protein